MAAKKIVLVRGGQVQRLYELELLLSSVLNLYLREIDILRCKHILDNGCGWFQV